MNEVSRKDVEESRRSELKKSKPLVYEKIMKYNEKEARGESIAIIDLVYDYICNMRCQHCSAAKIEKKSRVMTVNDVHNIALQADALGLAQFNLNGGEPLIFKEIDEVIQALMPEKFHLCMSTNGFFLDLERAKHLKSIGLDKVKISVDSINEETHNRNRSNNQSYQKSINALFAAKEAGLQVVMQHVITHQTAQSEELVKLCEFGEKHGFALDMLVARAVGEWEGREDILIDEEDAKALRALHDRFPFAWRDVFPHYGVLQGCGSVSHNLHITKYGDVFPCVFLQIAIGNVFEESLKDIIDRGFNIKHFREFNPLCLSGEDRNFMNKYMKKCIGKPVPVDYRDIFTEEDFVDPKKML